MIYGREKAKVPVWLIDEEFVKTALLNEIERRNKEC